MHRSGAWRLAAALTTKDFNTPNSNLKIDVCIFQSRSEYPFINEQAAMYSSQNHLVYILQKSYLITRKPIPFIALPVTTDELTCEINR